MTFQIVPGTARYWSDAIQAEFPWIVEKVLEPGETYTIASFRDKAQAQKCLDSLRSSVEVQNGALVTEAH